MTDFNMLNILKSFNDVEKKTLKESTITECPPGMPAASKTPMSVNISGDASDIAAMLRTLGGIESKPAVMAMDVPMDMPKIPGEGADNRPDEAYMDTEELMAGGDDIHAEKEPEDIRVKDNAISHEIRDEEIDEWDNEPDEDYADHSMMLDKLSGGINGKKKMYKRAQPGDNAMAVESIKDRLWAALNEKKVTEISSDLAKRYTKAAKMDRDFNDDDITRMAKSGQSTQDMHRRNAKRTKGINRAAKRIEK